MTQASYSSQAPGGSGRWSRHPAIPRDAARERVAGQVGQVRLCPAYLSGSFETSVSGNANGPPCSRLYRSRNSSSRPGGVCFRNVPYISSSVGRGSSFRQRPEPSSPSEDYLTVLAGQRQWIATTNFAGCPGRPPDSFANSAVLTTSAKFLMRWAGPSTRAFLCRLTPKRNSLSRLWPVQISDHSPFAGGYVNRCVNDIRRRPSQPLIQWRFHPHTVHRDRRLRSTQGPSDA